MFLPVTDYYSNGEIHYTGNLGYYWSRTLHETTSYKAYYLFFYTSSNLECTYGNRYSGYAVRAVRTQTYWWLRVTNKQQNKKYATKI